MNLQDRIVLKLNDVMPYNVRLRTRKLAETLRENDPELKSLVSTKKVNDTLYNVLNAARRAGMVASFGSKAQLRWEKRGTMTPGLLQDAISANLAHYREQAKKKQLADAKAKPKPIPATVVQLPVDKPRNLSAAIEYLSIIEEAVIEAKAIIEDIQNNLT